MHSHDEQDDHEAHPDRPVGLSPSARPLTSVGIDIGSATTQVLISRLWLDLVGGLVTSRSDVVHREVLYSSPLVLTPFQDGNVIDAVGIRTVVLQAYGDAGVAAGQVETGALIVTGEAARKSNADAVAEAVAGLAGAFVCIAAGAHLEARLAAYGSGAVEMSRAAGSSSWLHVDVGGATTKLAVLVEGRIVETAAVDVGARMLTFDLDDGRITSSTAVLRRLATQRHIDVAVGALTDPRLRVDVAVALAQKLTAFVRGASDQIAEMTDAQVTQPLTWALPFTHISYSGGVAAYVYGAETRDFGDLGPELGPALRKELAALGAREVVPPRTIRATATGASQFSTQVSGTTTHHADEATLPLRGLRVVPLSIPDGPIDEQQMAADVLRAYATVDLRPDGDVAYIIALRWEGDPSYERLRALAVGLDTALPRTCLDVLAIAIDRDLGGALGAALQQRRPGRRILCLDEVSLEPLDLVDVGAPVSMPPVLPVTVRSVQFLVER